MYYDFVQHNFSVKCSTKGIVEQNGLIIFLKCQHLRRSKDVVEFSLKEVSFVLPLFYGLPTKKITKGELCTKLMNNLVHHDAIYNLIG